ncbi:WYL domain-containing protein [Verrucomicrobiaceae bacterium 5K15]|uniref:WYL domain-containing protein n=1 Tax=Oceaniferula flava TaxID=2800421 RepID=A0AAE2V8L3_9BACT|nr:WYL domain-containing protein [Oceaniferula flavus]MBK1855747.1 WYL domain-containing protein [Oceaniferula flavus]MBM1137054.1 WYL domain-containing protein [Oceaniferula flavus]
MSGFSGGGKVQMRRIYAIVDAVKGGGYPNCRSLAERLEVTPKTIQRDINFIRDQLALPLEYNQTMHGYEFTSDVNQFPVFEAQVEDLAALFLARHAMKSVKGTKLAEALKPAFERLTKQLDGKVNMNWSSIDQVFTVKETGVVDADLTLFGKLAEAVLNGHEVSFLYRKLGDQQSIKRRLQPYHVGEIDGGWYVVGHDVMRNGLRTFALQRIKGLKVLKAHFQRPADFQIGRHLGGSIGVWDHQENELQEVVVEVSGWVARIVQERLWHPSQTTRVLDERGENVELRMRLGNLEEMKHLILSWGASAKVLAPKALRHAVREEAAGVVEIYRA